MLDYSFRSEGALCLDDFDLVKIVFEYTRMC